MIIYKYIYFLKITKHFVFLMLPLGHRPLWGRRAVTLAFLFSVGEQRCRWVIFKCLAVRDYPEIGKWGLWNSTKIWNWRVETLLVHAMGALAVRSPAPLVNGSLGKSLNAKKCSHSVDVRLQWQVLWVVAVCEWNHVHLPFKYFSSYRRWICRNLLHLK